MKYIYLCGEGVAKQLELVGKKKENHNYKQTKNTIYIWPNSTNKETINPTKIKMIKTHYKIKSIVILDRTRGPNSPIKARDHINKTGENYLIGNTPNNGMPRFPDASNIYKEKDGLVFESYGPTFNKVVLAKNSNRIISEWLAPVALVWSYVGATVMGRGIPENIKHYNGK